jgi:threonine dehydratase
VTPLERAPAALASYARVDDLWLKREDLHELGAFKWRAALPVVSALARDGDRAIVTSSTGNHGAAVAWACRRLGAEAIVFVPPGAAEAKLALLRELGADVRVAGSDLDDAKEAARAYAGDAGLPFFEDGAEPMQYDAYGAIADEILDDSPTPPDVVVTPLGNGALAGGVGAVLRRRAPGVRHLGVVTHEMPVMAASHEAGEPVEVETGATIADGLAVRVAIPLAVTRLADVVDEMVRVSERELADALVACHEAGVLVEPSAAAAVAAERARSDEGRVVLVLTGRNVDPALVARAREHPESFAQPPGSGS